MNNAPRNMQMILFLNQFLVETLKLVGLEFLENLNKILAGSNSKTTHQL